MLRDRGNMLWVGERGVFFASGGFFFGWTLEIHPIGAEYTFGFFALPGMLLGGGDSNPADDVLFSKR